jgi:hypothetical protein
VAIEETYDPIQAVITRPRIHPMQRRLAPEPGVALVVLRAGRPLSVLKEHWEELHWLDPFLGLVRKVYRVDVSEHPMALYVSLPCASDAFFFEATLRFTCRVVDPITVIRRGVRDVRPMLEPALVETMRATSRGFAVDACAHAEVAIAGALERRSRADGFSDGFLIQDVFVRLQLDDAARAHVRARQEATFRHQEQVDRIRQDRARLSLQSELDDAKARLEIRRAGFYQDLVELGEWRLLMLQLARNPDDVGQVASAIGNLDHLAFERQLKALQFMLDNDALENTQLEESGKRLLRELLQTIKSGRRGVGETSSSSHPAGQPDLKVLGEVITPDPGGDKT